MTRSARTLVPLAALCLLLSAASPAPLAADEAAEKEAAQAAVLAWLGEMDGGEYGPSWDHASELFQRNVTRAAWIQALDGARTPLGSLSSRTLKSSQYLTQVPGAPDGEYVVFQFESSFEKKKVAIETVTVAKESGGSESPDGWRGAGYFIR